MKFELFGVWPRGNIIIVCFWFPGKEKHMPPFPFLYLLLAIYWEVDYYMHPDRGLCGDGTELTSEK